MKEIVLVSVQQAMCEEDMHSTWNIDIIIWGDFQIRP